MPEVRLRFIGHLPDDLRWFIQANGRHAGGITLHSISGDCFSYGIAVSPAFRRQGIAKTALLLLFQELSSKNFRRAAVDIHADNTASLALHQSLGFIPVSGPSGSVIRMTRDLPPSERPSEDPI